MKKNEEESRIRASSPSSSSSNFLFLSSFKKNEEERVGTTSVGADLDIVMLTLTSSQAETFAKSFVSIYPFLQAN